MRKLFPFVVFLFSFSFVFGSSLDDLVDSYDDVIVDIDSGFAEVILLDNCDLSLNFEGEVFLNFALLDERFQVVNSVLDGVISYDVYSGFLNYFSNSSSLFLESILFDGIRYDVGLNMSSCGVGTLVLNESEELILLPDLEVSFDYKFNHFLNYSYGLFEVLNVGSVSSGFSLANVNSDEFIVNSLGVYDSVFYKVNLSDFDEVFYGVNLDKSIDEENYSNNYGTFVLNESYRDFSFGLTKNALGVSFSPLMDSELVSVTKFEDCSAKFAYLYEGSDFIGRFEFLNGSVFFEDVVLSSDSVYSVLLGSDGLDYNRVFYPFFYGFEFDSVKYLEGVSEVGEVSSKYYFNVKSINVKSIG